MKKTLLIAAASTLSFGISSVVSAGDIEKAERYTAPLEQQTVVEMDVSVVEMGQVIETSKELGLGSNAEVQELGMAWSGSNAEVQELGRGGARRVDIFDPFIEPTPSQMLCFYLFAGHVVCDW